MARTEKHNKVTHSLAGKSAAEKKKALHKMVEALVADKIEDANTLFHSYVTAKTHDILVGESDDSDDEKIEKDEEKEEEDKDDEDKEVDEKDDEDEKEEKDEEKKVEEALTFVKSSGKKSGAIKHGNSSPGLSDKISGEINFDGTGKKSGALKHGNSSPELSDSVKGKVNFKGTGKKSGALKHGNAAPELSDAIKGNVYKN